MTDALPNLGGVATESLVEQIGTGNFSARYINWSRTMQMLREHAPGWLPELVPTIDGNVLHRAPVGGYLMMRFRNGDRVTEAVPQAVMDNRNAAIPFDKITARDVTDTHRRGLCLAAALTFGLAYELWAKMPLETGFGDDTPPANDRPDAGEATTAKRTQLAGPYTSKTALWNAVKAFDRELRGCGDPDQLDAFVNADDSKALLQQCERDAPQLLHGGDAMPPEYEPLYGLIAKLRSDLEAAAQYHDAQPEAAE